jgi:hypothetical protein
MINLSNFTTVKIDARSWRFADGLDERLNFLRIYLLTDANTFFVKNINENKIGRILSKEWYGSSHERNFRMYQLKNKHK